MPTDNASHPTGNQNTAATTVAELLDARRPCERSAAMTLAVAQRDLRVALASNPEQVAGWPRLPGEPLWTDPVPQHVAWVVRMVEFEQQIRAHTLSSLRSCEDYDRRHDRAAEPLGEVIAVAVGRARAAISAMLGSDPVLADAARADVLHGWPEDDQLAVLALDGPR